MTASLNYRRPPQALRGRVVGAPAAVTLVVDAVLHDGGVIAFRGHLADGTATRCVARRALMRVPVAGETWALEGTWEEHPVYGRQLGTLTSATLVRPSGQLFIAAISRNSKGFPGIGVVRAQRLWDAHGERIFDLLDTGDVDPLAAQVGAEHAAILVAGWRALNAEAKAYRWLTRHGFPPSLATKVIAIYGSMPVPAAHAEAAAEMGTVVWHLFSDPYRMLAFANWRKTDAAARQLGVGDRDPRRLVGAVEAACARHLAEGHTWIDRPTLRATASRLLCMPAAVAEEGVQLSVAQRALVEHAGGYQTPGAAIMERYIGERVARMQKGKDAPEQMRLVPSLTGEAVDRLLDQYDATQPYPLSVEQRAAVWMSLTEPVSLLLGGPGVGKTTVLRAVHHLAGALGRTVHQAALAGRAAQRMRQATGRQAHTLAGLLARIEQQEIVLDDEPLLVIDEASMCDLAILYRVLRRCPPGVRLLLVGDPGQLPPIGFGLVFHVLAAGARDAVPRTVLTVPRRQHDASVIPAVCAAIRDGVPPDLPAPNWSQPAGVSFIDVPPRQVTPTIIDVLSHVGPDCPAQIIGSVKNGPGGTIEINQRLQSLRAVGRGAQLNGRFFPGDPVIVTKNDWDLGVMNGDLGVAVGNEEDGALRVRLDEGEKVLPAALLVDDVDLAYAITCHKAQGSQFPTVVVPVTPNKLLDRALLLTAVSRAQERVVLVGDRSAFVDAVTRAPAFLTRQVGLAR